ncbi:putative oxidoreductase YjmC [Castellaniella defragrans]
MTDSAQAWLAPDTLRRGVSALFRASGLDAQASDLVARALVDADLAGIPSHGVALATLYLDRLRAGSVSPASQAEIVRDEGSVVTLDAHHALGQVTSAQAVSLLKERAPVHGLAAVSVRHAFHFGAAGYWAGQLAENGLVGIALSNTRPLMPAPGGAGRVVGNNPLAIAVPSDDEPPLVFDMAASASAMGKIRLAAQAGQPIPDGWALDSGGAPTTDAARAIQGMLLPAAGPKGFGLAFMVDLLCGGLSDGSIADEVRPLYGDLAQPYDCAHFFVALEIAQFVPVERFAARARRFAATVRHSPRAEGVERLFTPGERAAAAREDHRASCPVARETLRHLSEAAEQLGLGAVQLF